MSFDCKVCNKKYKSYQSLWNHNKKFHVQTPQPSTKPPQESLIIPQSSTKLECRYCNKKLSRIDSKKRHEENCSKNIEEQKEKEKQEEAKQKQIELELKKKDAEILKLKLKLQKQVDYVTLKKLNKMLVKHNNSVTNVQNINITNNNSNNNLTNNNLTNNNSNNNFQIMVITPTEKKNGTNFFIVM